MPEENLINQAEQSQDIPQEIAYQSTQDPEPAIDIKKREREILGKKIRFKLFLTISIIGIAVLIAAPIVINFYKKHFIKNVPIIEEIPEENKIIKVGDLEVEEKVLHNSDKLWISLEYLNKTLLREYGEEFDQIRKLEVVYEKQGDPENTTPESLNEGYILRVSTFLTSLRQLDEIVKVKKDSFIAYCPTTAEFSEIEKTTIDGREGRTFEVINCGADYKVTYVVKNEINYEFAQIFKGDIGYRQFYKAETDEIMDSVKFYPDKIDEGPLETYTDEKYGFSFEHPRFISDCCDITGPMSDSSKKQVVLADPDTLINRDNFSGFGVFIDRLYGAGDFNTYLDGQKKILVDDYIVVRGAAPKLEVKSLKIGDRNGTMLSGYSWRGNDLIFLDISDTINYNMFLVISVNNTSGKDFERKMDEILKSFKFFEKKAY